MSTKKSERIAAVIISLSGLMVMYYAWQSLKLGSIHVPDAGLLPFLCGAGLAVLGVLWILVIQTSEDQAGAAEAETEKRMPWRPILSLGLMIVYALAMEALGYITSTVLFMVAWQQLIEREKWVKTIIIAVLGTVAMYALFSLFLKVPIPEELFLR